MSAPVGFKVQPNIQDLPISIGKFILPKEAVTSNIASPVFQQMNQNWNDWHIWRQISDSLSIKDAVPLNIKTNSDDQTKTEFYKNAIDGYFKKETDVFLYLAAKCKDEMSELEDINKEELSSFIDSIPKFEEKGPLPHAQHYQRLCKFVQEHHKSEFLESILFDAIENLPLVKMLLEQGVEPSAMDIKDNDCNKTSLKWVTFLTYNPEMFYDVEFCKLVLNRDFSPVDSQGLTYLLWIISHDSLKREDDALAIIKLLTLKGARWDIEMIKNYPPIELTDENTANLAFCNEDNWKKHLHKKV